MLILVKLNLFSLSLSERVVFELSSFVPDLPISFLSSAITSLRMSLGVLIGAFGVSTGFGVAEVGALTSGFTTSV